MSFTQTKSESKYSRSSLINLEDMDIRGRKIEAFSSSNQKINHQIERRKVLSTQGSGRRMLPASYFSIEALFLLICLTATLLILPLILPPLPPPPFLLLLLPIGILGVLMFLAFMPTTNARDLTTFTNV